MKCKLGDKISDFNDKMPRKMLNGDISIPYSCAFVLKNLCNFDSKSLTMECAMTIIMRIKITGLDELADKPIF